MIQGTFISAALAAAVLSSPAAFAQAAPFGGPMRHEMLFLAGSQLERERIVQGAPYCADAVHETVQTLSDGNRIVQKQSSRQCRDSEGRTRQEVSNGKSRHVFLRDPVAHEAWMLDADNKRAVRLDAPLRGAPMPEVKQWSEKMRDWAKSLREHLPFGGTPADGAGFPPPPAPPMGMDGGPEAMRIVMHGPHPAEFAPPPDGAMPPSIALHARMLGPRGPGVTNLLPATAIEGLKADGKRTTWTIEAGRIGNERPIVITNEVWMSPELGVTIRSNDANPLSGEDTFRLQNVARGEPDAQLFRVPADYVKTAQQAFGPPRRP